MSTGRIYRSEMDALLGHSLTRLENTVNSDNIVANAKGIVTGALASNMTPPFRILVPSGTNLSEHEEGENVTLEQRLKDIEHVTEVKVGKGRGISVESIGDEKSARKAAGY